MEPQKSPHTPLVAAVVLIALLALGLYFWKDDTRESVPAATTSSEKVAVTKVDLATKSGVERLPVGFLSGLPIEHQSIFESYSTAFPERKVSQKTVSYTSAKSAEVVFKEYLSFMTKAGYTFSADGKNESEGLLFGTKGDADLTIVVKNVNGVTTVTITYLQKSI